MKSGMLWLDDDEEFTLIARVHNAIKYFFDKYGYMPDTVMVNEEDLDKELEVEGIRLVPCRTVLRHHFYIGRESEQ